MVLSFSIAAAAMHFGRRSEWYRNHLYQRLLTGGGDERLRAASGLAQVGGEEQLLRALKLEQPDIHTMARRALEHLWFHAAGREAFQEMEVAYQAAEREDYKEALQILDRLVIKYPNYAEAWNRRAAVFWKLGEYDKSMKDCERALDLNPNHYGAWQGIGVCHLQLGEVDEACRSLRLALKIAPYDADTRRSLEKVEELMRVLPQSTDARPRTELL